MDLSEQIYVQCITAIQIFLNLPKTTPKKSKDPFANIAFSISPNLSIKKSNNLRL